MLGPVDRRNDISPRHGVQQYAREMARKQTNQDSRQTRNKLETNRRSRIQARALEQEGGVFSSSTTWPLFLFRPPLDELTAGHARRRGGIQGLGQNRLRGRGFFLLAGERLGTRHAVLFGWSLASLGEVWTKLLHQSSCAQQGEGCVYVKGQALAALRGPGMTASVQVPLDEKIHGW